MSEKNTAQSKTEQPTPKRLRDLRKKGQVARSADASATVVVLVGIVVFAAAGGYVLDRLRRILERSASADFAALADNQALLQWTRGMLVDAVLLVLPIVVVLALAGALTSAIQVGGVFSVELIKPQLSRVNPVEGARRLFSLYTLIELTKLLVKVLALAAVICLIARESMPVLLRSHWLPANGILPLAVRLFALLAWSAVGCFLAIAIFDLWFQSWYFKRRNRMSIDEVRRDRKDSEGDPHIRARRRALHREVSEATTLQNVRKANVVIVNPTHIAVALYYAAGETDLPVVVAKGEDALAREIRRVAEQERIPILHDVDLARRLQAGAPVNEYIPEELIEPVAAVLRWVFELKAKP